MSSRSSMRKEIYDALKSVEGIGHKLAAAGAENIMQRVLDPLVNTQDFEEEERDADGIKMMWRPSCVPPGYNYLTWSSNFKALWVMTGKPLPPGKSSDHWGNDPKNSEEANLSLHFSEHKKLFDSLESEDDPNEHIRRLI